MNIKQRWNDKTNIGIIANLVSTAFMIELMIDAFDYTNDKLPNYIFYGVILLNVLFLIKSTKEIKREGRHTKLASVGKLFALFLAIVTVYVVYDGRVIVTTQKSILELILAASIIIYVPYSFYLFRNKEENVELPPQADDKITADKLKMPPNAWD